MRKTALVFACVMLMAGVAGAQQGPGKPTDPEHDYKTFNGNLCHPRNGSEVGDFIWYVRGISNISSEYREVSCPIDRDDFRGLGTVEWVELVTRQHSGNSTCCTFYSFDRSGVSYIDSYEICIDYDGIYGVSKYPYLATEFGGYLGMHCDIPPGGWILKYSVSESYPTDHDN